MMESISERIARLKKEKDAVILAHYYAPAEVQDMADCLGDSLGLSRTAAGTGAKTIIFAGVHFMAETAAILCPGKTVLSPAPDAAVLDESGSRLLTAEVLSNTYSYEAGGFGQTVSTDLSDHLELAVYDLATGRMTYQGMLHTGAEAAWDPGAAHLPRTYFVFDDALQGEGAV